METREILETFYLTDGICQSTGLRIVIPDVVVQLILPAAMAVFKGV